MDKKTEALFIRAICDDDAGAFYRLGVRLLHTAGGHSSFCKTCSKEKRIEKTRICGTRFLLGKVCLQKAAELGCEKAFILYHRLFSGGKKVIDDASYERMAEAYFSGERNTAQLTAYLRLGTRKQKRAALEKAAKTGKSVRCGKKKRGEDRQKRAALEKL